MGNQLLTTDDGLRQACESLGGPDNWGEDRQQWIDDVAATIEWVRGADETERRSEPFQQRLWEDNKIAAVGQGTIALSEVLGSRQFREWLAARSVEPLPADPKARLAFLTELYEELTTRIRPFVDKIPHLKIFRVMAALYPEVMTTVADRNAIRTLTRALGVERGLQTVECHLWTRNRLDALLGPPANTASALAERMSLPWMLYERFVRKSTGQPPDTPVIDKDGKKTLHPLPAARRRRGLTPIRGLFQGALSVMEFVKEGVTRPELIDFLRASSPESKDVSLGMTINVLQSELGAIKRDGELYSLSEAGETALDSQSSRSLADWILTRILGPDAAIIELREQGTVAIADLNATLRESNPGWKSDFVPQSILGWLRSLGVIEAGPRSSLRLTGAGKEWAALIHWQPESLASDDEDTEIVIPGPAEIVLPNLPAILASVRKAGYFSESLVCSLHASLWAHRRRHFAILTGLSGSGKTLLARSYAAALIQNASERQLLTLPVQPGWYDPGALLGFTNPLRGDSYIRTPFLDFLIAAVGDPSRPYIAVLDEMNLSHPEQYMAPLLSAMETGDRIQLHSGGDFLDSVPSAVPYPRNLVIIGTVNMDETTHGLSDKVLDRAFVHEFWEVDLASYPHWDTGGMLPADAKRVRDLLSALMASLSPARLHFGWRVVDDVLDFVNGATSTGSALSFDTALDSVVYSKVLPKLRGDDSPRFRDALKSCEEVLGAFALTRSLAKVVELRRDLETTGSARFWR